MEGVLQILQNNILSFLILVPIVTGLVQVAKRAGFVQKYCSLLAIVFGVLLVTILGALSTVPFTINLVVGLVVGLAASGLWEGGKAIKN